MLASPPSAFAALLRAQRRRAGLSQAEVARRLGVPRATYVALELHPDGRRLTARTVDLVRRATETLAFTGEDQTAALAAARACLICPTPRRPRPDPQRPAWAEFLIDLRLSRGLTAARAARRLGVTQQTWSGLEAGTRRRGGQRVPIALADRTVLRIARALDLTAAETSRLGHLTARAAREAAPPRRPWQIQLRGARLASQLTAAQAATLAQVTPATYREWERHPRRTPHLGALHRLLPHLGLDAAATHRFLTAVASPTQLPRPPRQPSRPVTRVPAWSQFLTARRLAAGLHLAQVDRLVGQQSIVRRFELGGWPRADGRLSVPSRQWLDRVAAALSLTPADRAQLHHLADAERLHLAATGPRPLLAELLHEARRAAGLTLAQAHAAVPGLPAGWAQLERGHPPALAALDGDTLHRLVAGLPAPGPLGEALRHAHRHPGGGPASLR